MSKINSLEKATHVIDFQLSAGYTNYKCFQFFASRKDDKEILPGYIAPVVQYIEKEGNIAKSITVHYSDIQFLTEEKEKATQYLLLLINAEKGDENAKKELFQIKERYYEESLKSLKSSTIKENLYIVPSITRKHYSKKFVSQKGVNLLELTRQGYPVPDFCILTAQSFQLQGKVREKHLKSALKNLEQLTGRTLGGTFKPLIFAMRCALPEYIPGLMPTYLNVGVTTVTYPALVKKYGEIAADKIYFNNLKNIYTLLFSDDVPENIPYTQNNLKLKEYIKFYKKKIASVNADVLDDAYAQFIFFFNKISEFYLNNKDLIYTFQKGEHSTPSLILQKMVWTIRDGDSYPGVIFSRHSRTGIGVQIQSLKNIFGEDIMSGLINSEDTEFFDREEIKEEFPAIYHFCPNICKLEQAMKAPVAIEFAAESFEKRYLFAVLQLDFAELTGRGILLSAIDMYRHKIISKRKVLKLIYPYHLRQIFSESIDDSSFKTLEFFSPGISILPRSAVSARIFFSSAGVLEAKKRGDKVCFCKETFTPLDRVLISEVDAILSLTPAAIHVVTACLGYGIPSLINLDNYGVKMLPDAIINAKGVKIKEGEWITISSKHHTLFKGKAAYKPARFQKYLEGQPLEMDAKEEKVFVNMSDAFKAYQQIVDSLETGEIHQLSDLIKIIRNDLHKQPDKAENFVNSWYDKHTAHYIEQILKSELGTHLDQHRIYSLLTVDRRVDFMKRIIPVCINENLKGFSAGSFMLGRFMSQMHPMAFWRELSPEYIVFLLNEYVLFEKYLQVLNDFDERHINKVRNELLNDGLSSIAVSHNNVESFIPLKLYVKNWNSIDGILNKLHEKDTYELIRILQQPYGEIFNYNQPWSISKLEEICAQENIACPKQEDE